MARARYAEIDILRGIAAILMILGHSFIVYPVNIASVPWCHVIEHFIYNFHMELFFVLAGAVYYCMDYRTFIQKKVKRILVPYVFFGVITLLLKAFGGSAINGNESVGYGLLKLILHGGNYWFLYVLFIIFAVYPFLEHLFKTWQSELFIAFALLTVRQLSEITDIFTIGRILYYLPFFVTGKIIFSKMHKGGAQQEISKGKKATLLLIGITLYCMIDYLEIRTGYELGAILSYVRAISIISVLYILVEIILTYRQKKTGLIYNLISDCGKLSLQLYLFNGFLLTGLRILICKILQITSPVFIAGGIWIGNLVITLVLCKVCIPRIPILRDLCGLR